MNIKPYPKYKDSGVEWLGEVPEPWNVRKLRFVFSIKKNIAGKEGYDVLSVTQQGIKIKDIESNDGQLALDYSKYQLVAVGDFAMNHMDLITGYVDISPCPGVTSPDYRVFALKDISESDPKYNLYILQLCYQHKLFYHLGQGVSGFGRWRLPRDQFYNFALPSPPKIEQQEIALFLNRETSVIDALIAKKQRQIELLQEKRTALISHAVTKGLDPNVKMKDSGVEWLGEVPVHWKVRKLRYLIKGDLVNGLFKKKEYYGSGIKIANVFDVYQEDYYLSNATLEQVEVTEDEKKKYAIQEGDIFFVRSSLKLEGVGRSVCALTVEEPMVFECHVVRACPKQRTICPKYLIHFLNSAYAMHRFIALANCVTMATIDQDKIKNLEVTLPPRDEQDQIMGYLAREMTTIEELKRKITESIEKLYEYRIALISAAVTGKIDVRGEKVA